MNPFDDLAQAVRPDSPSGGARVYLLIDHAGAPGLLAELRRRMAIRWISLFEDSTEQGALEVAPILIQLPEAAGDARERALLTWLHRACAFSTSLTVLHSTLTQERLASALRRRLDLLLPEQMPVLLRYFDTRILQSLLPLLAPAQRSGFLGIASRWQWFDRKGQLQRQDAEQLHTDAWPPQFEADVAQQNALIEAGTADALVQQMQLIAPDICRPKTRADLYELATACLPRLTRLAIDDIRSQTLYCLTALRLGSAFDLQPTWTDALARVGKKEITFAAALKEHGV